MGAVDDVGRAGSMFGHELRTHRMLRQAWMDQMKAPVLVGLLHRSMYLWVLRDEDEERGGPDDAQLRCCTCVGNAIG